MTKKDALNAKSSLKSLLLENEMSFVLREIIQFSAVYLDQKTIEKLKLLTLKMIKARVLCHL
jgi:hypothetical protein